eukprot:9547738-Ditylum_brightwellii.AAC.1
MGIFFVRHSNRRMNSKNGKKSPSHPSQGKQMDVAEAKEERRRAPLASKKTTNKAGQLQHLSTRT